MLFYGHKYIEQLCILIFLSRLPTSIAKFIDYNVMHVVCYWVVQLQFTECSVRCRAADKLSVSSLT